MKPTIWLDVDGVLLDYTNPFLQFTGIDTTGVTYDNLFDYDLTKLFRAKEDCDNAMLRFAVSDEFKNLPPIAHRHDLEMLKNMGFSLQIITQLPAPPKSKIARIKNLTQNFGAVFDGVHFTIPGQCKLSYIRDIEFNLHNDYHILVEDNPNLLAKAEGELELQMLTRNKARYEVYAVVHPYNQEVVSGLHRVAAKANFSGVADTIATSEVFRG